MIKHIPNGWNEYTKYDAIIGNINAMKIIKNIPSLYEFKKLQILGFFDQPSSILEPSRGGMGKALKTAKIVLYMTIFNKNNLVIPLGLFLL